VSASKSEATPRSCGLIFTCGKMKIATSPLFYKGAAFFMPEKMGNLHNINTPFLRLGIGDFHMKRHTPLRTLPRSLDRITRLLLSSMHYAT
ncbi:MAG: hypothetical protein J6N18_15130, partial [Kiritimatiellae bacterium]|nr:hypothetical protein [Kiritimatiellia bacterium]